MSLKTGLTKLYAGEKKNRAFHALVLILSSVALLSSASELGKAPKMGKQPDGTYLVSTEQSVDAGAIAFSGRPIDMAMHPSGEFAAVLNHSNTFLVSHDGVLPKSGIYTQGAGYRGVVWSPDGSRLYVSCARGVVQELLYHNGHLSTGREIAVKNESSKRNPRPGGMTITKDGARLFVAVLDKNSVVEIDLATKNIIAEFPVQNLPFEVKLSEDEKTLVVSNWGGRKVNEDDEQAISGSATVVVDPRGASASGTVSFIHVSDGGTKYIEVGLHPTAIAIEGRRAYIANAASDSLTEIDIPLQKTLRTLPLHWGAMNLFGSMPCALAIRKGIAYICNGGDNAICEMVLSTGAVRGFRPAGFYPVAIALSRKNSYAFILNTKGNGSVLNTSKGRAGNVRDFQGTVSIIDLASDLKIATKRVAANNGWDRERKALHPNLAVYQGAIQHVLYIIKENRTYDEIFGDMPQGDGDPKLCSLGESITPNSHALARQFALFDNAYVAGTNSADGHQWSTQAFSNDYIEHFYTGYRTYPFAGDCAMAISSAGSLWDAALNKGRTIRDYGEFCDSKLAIITPSTKNWLDLWNDRKDATHLFRTHAGTRIKRLRPYIHPEVLQWPLLQSDQRRADLFISDYRKRSRAGIVPNLMILSLPCDHTEGRNPNYPKPKCMIADNDLALGRIVEAVSRSPEWKSTCIFVIEDDTQFGLDHVDGHRTLFFVISPYTKRKIVDHELSNTVSMIRSIELMLGLDPMNRFDALTPPLRDCFSNTPDYSSYKVVPNRIVLDEMNLPLRMMQGADLFWAKKSLALDWSGPDRADPETLDRVIWSSLHENDNAPYPQLARKN